MKDDIKEILREAKEFEYIDINAEKTNLLLNYITNLQEENVRFREIICFNEDYKSRIDKAIEYCNNIMFETKREEKIQDDLLNILQGENK